MNNNSQYNSVKDSYNFNCGKSDQTTRDSSLTLESNQAKIKFKIKEKKAVIGRS